MYASHISEKVSVWVFRMGNFCNVSNISETCYSLGAPLEANAPVPNYFLLRFEAASVELAAIPCHADNEIRPQG
jgi:hypothetical protein